MSELYPPTTQAERERWASPVQRVATATPRANALTWQFRARQLIGDVNRQGALNAKLVEALETMSRDWHKVARHGGAWEECDALCHGHRNVLVGAKKEGKNHV